MGAAALGGNGKHDYGGGGILVKQGVGKAGRIDAAGSMSSTLPAAGGCGDTVKRGVHFGQKIKAQAGLAAFIV